jgi:hypothetical protein
VFEAEFDRDFFDPSLVFFILSSFWVGDFELTSKLLEPLVLVPINVLPISFFFKVIVVSGVLLVVLDDTNILFASAFLAFIFSRRSPMGDDDVSDRIEDVSSFEELLLVTFFADLFFKDELPLLILLNKLCFGEGDCSGRDLRW